MRLDHSRNQQRAGGGQGVHCQAHNIEVGRGGIARFGVLYPDPPVDCGLGATLPRRARYREGISVLAEKRMDSRRPAENRLRPITVRIAPSRQPGTNDPRTRKHTRCHSPMKALGPSGRDVWTWICPRLRSES